MIHKVDGHFVISSHHCWIPGVFESERAARVAFQFTDEQLKDLQRIANEKNGGVITLQDLKERWPKRKDHVL